MEPKNASDRDSSKNRAEKCEKTKPARPRCGWLGMRAEWAQARRDGKIECKRGQGHAQRRRAVRAANRMVLHTPGLVLQEMQSEHVAPTIIRTPSLVLGRGQCEVQTRTAVVSLGVGDNECARNQDDTEVRAAGGAPRLSEIERMADGAAAEGAQFGDRVWEGKDAVLGRLGQLRDELMGSDRKLSNPAVQLKRAGDTPPQPVQALELAVLGTGTLVWEACGRWAEGNTQGSVHLDRFGELWKVSAAAGSHKAAVELPAGPRMEGRADWVRSKMVHLKTKQFAEVQRMWWKREVVRLETFFQFCKLGGGSWSATVCWQSHSGAGSGTLEKLLHVRQQVRDGVSDSTKSDGGLLHWSVGSLHWIGEMQRAAKERKEPQIWSAVPVERGHQRTRLQPYAGKVFTKAQHKEFLKLHMSRVLTVPRWSVATQTEVVELFERFERPVLPEQQYVNRDTVREIMTAQQQQPPKQPVIKTTDSGASTVVVQWTDAGNSKIKQLKRDVKELREENERLADLQVQQESERCGERSTQQGVSINSLGALLVSDNSLGALTLSNDVVQQQDDARESPSWATVACEPEAVVWQVRFSGKQPTLGGAWSFRAIREAIEGWENFVELKVDEGVYRFDYKKPWPEHFIWTGRGNTVAGKAEWRKAWVRRELRGLVLRESGEVMVRGLHKFFNVGQLAETQMGALRKLQVDEVTEKLDGQMVCGVVVGTSVQFWSRKGNTAVGVAAARIASSTTGDYTALVLEVDAGECTPVFEMVGRQSRIKADEGDEARLVLLAVRRHGDGTYWTSSAVAGLAQRFGVEAVKRLRGLEAMSIDDMRSEVLGWWGREGVIVRFSNGLWVKLKSRWWFRAGYSKVVQERAAGQCEMERLRKIRLGVHFSLPELRIAVVGWPKMSSVQTVRDAYPEAKKIEMVYDLHGKLRVTVLALADQHTRDEVLRGVRTIGKKKLCMQAAYSRRARTRGSVRVVTYKCNDSAIALSHQLNELIRQCDELI